MVFQLWNATLLLRHAGDQFPNPQTRTVQYPQHSYLVLFVVLILDTF